MAEITISGKGLDVYPIPKGPDLPQVLEVQMTDRGQFARWLINVECIYRGKTKHIATIAETTGLLNRTQFWDEAFERVTNPQE